MTPKEKAKELVEAMTFSCNECDYESKAKQCALIAVDEMLKLFIPFAAPYYYEVKKEILAL
jgi:hypothetical protein